MMTKQDESNTLSSFQKMTNDLSKKRNLCSLYKLICRKTYIHFDRVLVNFNFTSRHIVNRAMNGMNEPESRAVIVQWWTSSLNKCPVLVIIREFCSRNLYGSKPSILCWESFHVKTANLHSANLLAVYAWIDAACSKCHKSMNELWGDENFWIFFLVKVCLFLLL